jgi:hypothetical protein
MSAICSYWRDPLLQCSAARADAPLLRTRSDILRRIALDASPPDFTSAP